MHLLSLIVDTALVLNALYVGCDLAHQFHNTDLNIITWFLVFVIGMLRIAIFTIMYEGLIAIGVVLEDPFGTDESDLPALAFQATMREECMAYAKGVDEIDHKVWWPDFAYKPPAA